MQIGILSDTHGYFHPGLIHYLSEVDLILHAGDIGNEDILLGLVALAPVRAVFGNVDGFEIRKRWPEYDEFEFGDLRFAMTHIAGRPGRWQKGVDRKLNADPPDIFICGHSHILQIERVASMNNMLFVNPGAAGREGFHLKKTCVRLSIRDGKARTADVIHLDE
jgi:uncharacterized protein